MSSKLRTFYTILLTQAISQIGSQMTSLAIGIWLFQQTGDVTPLALVAFFALLPNVLLANVAGLIADRFDRRWVMAIADVGAAVGSLVLMVLFFSSAFQVWHLYVITLVQNIFRTFQNPAFTASVTMMVTDDQRDRANGIMQLTGPLAGIIAPALTAALYGAIGITGILAVDLVSFAVAIAALILVRIPAPPRSQTAGKPSIVRDLTAGFAFFWEQKPFLIMLLFVALINFIGTGFGTLQTPYLLSRTGNSEATLGILLTIANIGAIAGGIVMSAWGGTRPRIHTAMPAIILLGVCLVLFGLAQTPVTLAIGLFLFMAMPMFANIPLMSMMQAKVPPDKQGRVFAALMQFALLISPLSPLLAGPLADNVFEPAAQSGNWMFGGLVGFGAGAGIGLMIVIAGAVMASLATAAYALPMIRTMEATIPDWQPASAPSEDSELVSVASG
ncbi:MAG: MFS transporter [Chloroflexota bacterium]|nr:MFS transporter [Chloroflexota bacterium]